MVGAINTPAPQYRRVHRRSRFATSTVSSLDTEQKLDRGRLRFSTTKIRFGSRQGHSLYNSFFTSLDALPFVRTAMIIPRSFDDEG